ncbi:MAG: VacJ family lipoprotein [Rickettsiaceae bacterium]|nr:VacJ family lipoprotein [Rickettsiaceae bacterium]
MKIFVFKLALVASLLVFAPVHLLAAPAPQFNFDEDYQGEEGAIGGQEFKIYDPFESFNRKTFAFNEMLDKNIALPVVMQYRKVPKVVRNSVNNFVNNITTPFSIINSLLQGDGHNSMASFSSFLINTTLGVGGLFDVAGSKKIKYNEEDLGQVFAKYGMGTGPYLIIPFLGPSNFRDFSGFAIERAVSPLSFNALEIGGSGDFISDEVAISLAVGSAINTRDGLVEVVDDMRKNSFDVYSTMRSAYLQRRQALVDNKQ